MTDSNGLMDVLESLAGQGRIPLEDISHRDDPTLHARTPDGQEIHITSRRPDRIINEGSSHRERWDWGEYTMEVERDTQPGVTHPYAVVVKETRGSA